MITVSRRTPSGTRIIAFRVVDRCARVRPDGSNEPHSRGGHGRLQQFRQGRSIHRTAAHNRRRNEYAARSAQRPECVRRGAAGATIVVSVIAVASGNRSGEALTEGTVAGVRRRTGLPAGPSRDFASDRANPDRLFTNAGSSGFFAPSSRSERPKTIGCHGNARSRKKKKQM